MNKFWKDMKRPTDQMKTVWFRRTIVIGTSPVAFTVAVLASIAMILWGEFDALHEMWNDWKITITDCWYAPLYTFKLKDKKK